MKKIATTLLSITAIMLSIATTSSAQTKLSFSSDIRPIFVDNCARCHDGESLPSWDKAYTNIVGPLSQYSPTTGLKLVYPSKPDSSVLVWRLDGKTASGTTIDSMPYFSAKLPAATIKLIRDWITQGAPENSAQPPEPPSNVQVSDVPDDQGYYLNITWTLSPSESNGAVSWYRILHSRSADLTTPVPFSRYTSLDSLNAADAHFTILVESVKAGVNHFTDFVPVNGATYNVWIQAVGPGGASKPASGIQTGVTETPREFSLGVPYPNPFNPSTSIDYVLPGDARVLLKVYTATGQQVAVLVDGMEKQGKHTAFWNASGMPSGVYIVALNCNGATRVGKMVLLK